jgi:hypothetical protein
MDWSWQVLIVVLALTVVHLNFWVGRWVWFRLSFIEDRTIMMPVEDGPYGDPTFGELDPEISELIGDD